MPWGRIDDDLYDHEKLDLLGEYRLPALGLHLLALSWCNAKLTDGLVPEARARKLSDLGVEGTAELTEALLAAGLWEPAEGGYKIHDFLVYNDSRAQVLARREQAAQAGKLGGHARAEQRRRSGSPDDPPVAPPSDSPSATVSRPPSDSPVGPPTRPARVQRARDPDPTRVPSPDPTRSGTPSSPPVASSNRGFPSAVTRGRADATEPAPGGSRTARGSGNPLNEPRLTERQATAWSSFSDPAWAPFRGAWLGRGLRLPPAGDPTDDPDEAPSQRAMLWEIADARPNDLGRWVREAPARSKAGDVVAYVLQEWHALRERVEAEPEPTPGAEGGPDEYEAEQVLSAIEEATGAHVGRKLNGRAKPRAEGDLWKSEEGREFVRKRGEEGDAKAVLDEIEQGDESDEWAQF